MKDSTKKLLVTVVVVYVVLVALHNVAGGRYAPSNLLS